MTSTDAVKYGNIREVKAERRKGSLFSVLSQNASLILIAVMFIAGSILSLSFNIPIKNVMANYS